jgi:hypothetical protein
MKGRRLQEWSSGGRTSWRQPERGGGDWIMAKPDQDSQNNPYRYGEGGVGERPAASADLQPGEKKSPDDHAFGHHLVE